MSELLEAGKGFQGGPTVGVGSCAEIRSWMKEVRMALVRRTSKGPVASVCVQVSGMHVSNWTIGRFAR